MYLLAAVFLMLSGAAALIYQVTWVRLLGLSMGSTSASISTVLAAFFLGMAMGSYIAERISRNRINSFKPYIVIEAGIALSGLLLLPILLHLDGFIASIPTLGSILVGKFVITLLLLLVPTVCIGATFPIMASILIRKEKEIGLRLGQLYALNTFGAIFGALLAGFVFIPHYGLDGAIYIAVGLNAFVAVTALLFNRRINLPALESSEQQTTQNISPLDRKNQMIALLVLMGTGFTSIASEIGWTKYLSIFTGTTIFGFAAILGIFLMGIAAGSWAIRRYIDSIKSPQAWLAWGLLITALLLVYARVGMSFIPLWYEAINNISVSGDLKQWIKYGIVFVIIFPPTFAFGAIFPLNIKLYCGNLSGVQARVGKAYALNTLASIAGSIVAGFWLIPLLGTDVLLTLMSVVVLILALMFLFVSKIEIKKTAFAATTLTTLIAVGFLPHLNYEELISSVAYKFDPDASQGKKPEFLFIQEGKVSVISLITYDGEIAKVQANGLNESIIDMEDPSNALVIESMLAYFPYFLHENPQSVFIVGFGGGLTTRAFTNTNVNSIHIVELEPAVIEAGKQIQNGPVTALKDPRVQLNLADARNTLLIEDRSYDIIAAQPSHPWRAGASNVFTQDFFELVKSRLNQDGIFSQWVNLFRMDVTTLKSLFKAFFGVFPHGFTIANIETGDLMMLGSVSPLKFDFEQIARRMDNPEIKAALKHHKILKPVDLLWYFAFSRDEALQHSENGIANTDRNIFSEVRLSALLDEPTAEENPYKFLLTNYQFDITNYLPPDKAKDMLQKAGLYFLRWNAPDVTQKIITQLANLDKLWGKGLQHDVYVWRHDWQAATRWYNSNSQWLPQNHIQQLTIHLMRKEWQKAQYIIDRIDSKKWQRVGQAMMLYYQGEKQKLGQIAPQSDEEKLWQLTGLAQTDIPKAGKELEKIITLETESRPQIYTMIQYYAVTGQSEQLSRWSRRLSEIIDLELERYTKLTTTALKENNLEWNQELIDTITQIEPSYVGLPGILHRRKNKIESLAENSTKID